MCTPDPEHRQAWVSGDIVTEGTGGKWRGKMGDLCRVGDLELDVGAGDWIGKRALYSRNQSNSIRFVLMFSKLL